MYASEIKHNLSILQFNQDFGFKPKFRHETMLKGVCSLFRSNKALRISLSSCAWKIFDFHENKYIVEKYTFENMYGFIENRKVEKVPT
jgi:hypothetical protein